MLNTKRLIEMARKWRKAAALGRRRITSATTNGSAPREPGSTSIARRGHLFVYTTDGKRFMIPIAYLNHDIFRELFKMSEEEFGLPSEGPITLPCDGACMECIISLLVKRASKEVERTVLVSIVNSRCTTASLLPQGCSQEQRILYGF